MYVHWGVQLTCELSSLDPLKRGQECSSFIASLMGEHVTGDASPHQLLLLTAAAPL